LDDTDFSSVSLNGKNHYCNLTYSRNNSTVLFPSSHAPHHIRSNITHLPTEILLQSQATVLLGNGNKLMINYQVVGNAKGKEM